MRAFEQAVVIAIVLLNAYCLGADCVERFVNYATWPYIGAASFREYHRAQGPLIRLFIVAPLAVCFLLQCVFLIFCRSVRVDPSIPWSMFGSSLIGGVSTMLIQIPIHTRFDAGGYSSKLMRRLLISDWIRKAADLVRIVATILLLRQVVRI